MVEYRYYEDKNFDIADSPVIIDLNNDIGGRQEAIIICDRHEIGVAFEFIEGGVFGDVGTLKKKERLNSVDKILRIRLTTTIDNAQYRVWGSL